RQAPGPAADFGVRAVPRGLPQGLPGRLPDGFERLRGLLALGELLAAQLPDEPGNLRGTGGRTLPGEDEKRRGQQGRTQTGHPGLLLLGPSPNRHHVFRLKTRTVWPSPGRVTSHPSGRASARPPVEPASRRSPSTPGPTPRALAAGFPAGSGPR